MTTLSGIRTKTNTQIKNDLTLETTVKSDFRSSSKCFTLTTTSDETSRNTMSMVAGDPQSQEVIFSQLQEI